MLGISSKRMRRGKGILCSTPAVCRRTVAPGLAGLGRPVDSPLVSRCRTVRPALPSTAPEARPAPYEPWRHLSPPRGVPRALGGRGVHRTGQVRLSDRVGDGCHVAGRSPRFGSRGRNSPASMARRFATHWKNQIRHWACANSPIALGNQGVPATRTRNNWGSLCTSPVIRLPRAALC